MASPSARPTKRVKLDLTQTVKVLVGAEEKEYLLHKQALMQHSTFFKAALDGQFREASEQVIRLPEADHEVFPIFAQWTYSGAIVLLEPDDIDTDDKGKRQTNLLIRLYSMADMFGSSQLQNQVIDEYIDLLESIELGPSPVDIRLAYQRLPEQSKIIKAMLDWFMCFADMEWLRHNMKNLPNEFIKELGLGFGETLSEALAEVPRRKFPAHGEKCEYHVHDEHEPWCSVISRT